MKYYNIIKRFTSKSAKWTTRAMKTTCSIAACSILLATCSLLLINSCTIEPPLKLPAEDVVIEVPIVLQEFEVVWNIDTSWKTNWYFDWEETDSLLWGGVNYPMPTNYEVRRYFLGDVPDVPHTDIDAFTIWDVRFKRKFNFGYYDILIWSNIDSEDHTQVVVINESDPDNVIATTTTRSVKMYGPKTGLMTSKHYNQPEIFYSAAENNIYISRYPEDYDYYDEVENAWVKKLEAELNPLVYIYLVQVVLHNNKGRVSGVPESCAIDGLANLTSVTTGRTGMNDVSVIFGMRLKKDKKTKTGENVDVIGGKLTTYGLCDMPPWRTSRGATYKGSRADVKNNFALNLQFSNETDSTYYFDVTKQLQEQAHGGLITIDINVDSLKIPVNPNPPGGGSGFDPYVEEYKDTIIHEIEM